MVMNQETSIKVLTIDDDPMMRKNIATYLEKINFTVFQAGNGKVGLEQFHHHSPDLLLVDLQMPEVSGLEVIHQIKEESPDTPTIVVTGMGSLKGAMEAIEQGAWDYLVKPIDFNVLEYSIQKVLERSKLLKENQQYQDHLEQEIQNRTQELETANKQLEKEIYERKLSEAHLKTVINGSPIILWTMNQKGFITFLEGKGLETLKVQPGELAGQSIFEICANNPPVLKVMHRALAGEDFSAIIELGQFTLESKFSPIFNEQKKIIGSNVLTIDITERKQEEAERSRLEEQLRQSQKMEAIGTLAGGIAHDFNNILFAIMSYATMAEKKIPHENRARTHLAKILKACDRAKLLTKQILTYSRQTKQEFEIVDLHSIINEAIQLLRAAIPVTIEIQLEIEVPTSNVYADPTQIHQLLVNLGTNAMYAMREQGGHLTFSLKQINISDDFAKTHGIVKGTYFKMKISDTGTGIEPELLNRIFDPFFTTKPVDEGTGLGLAVVHGIIFSHNGAITVESHKGEGTTFDIYLPQASRKANSQESSSESPIIGDERILLVDDEEFIIEPLHALLEEVGYHVSSTLSSLEALEWFKQDPDHFDLVITDQTMSQMTGDKLTIKLQEIRQDIKIIIMTGFSEKLNEKRVKEIGAQGLILKPVSPLRLNNTIRQVLDAGPSKTTIIQS